MKNFFFVFACFFFSSFVLNAQENIALNKKATQSSNQHSGNRGWASKAIDGNTNGNYGHTSAGSVTHTKTEKGAWWQIDLRGVYDIATIKLYNRTDCCAERLTDFSIWVTPSGNWNKATKFDWKEASEYVNDNTSCPIYTFNKNLNARYIRIFLNGTGALSLAEVEVYEKETYEGTSADDKKQWMSKYWPELNDKKLNEICLPGTHNSGAYYLEQAIAPGAEQKTKDLFNIDLGGLREYMRKMSVTQEKSIIEQLNNGIRYLDFRIEFISGEFYITHGLRGNKLLVMLEDLGAFLDENSKEIVLIKLNVDIRNESGNLNPLGNYIQSIIPNHFTDKNSANYSEVLNSTLNSIVNTGKRAIFIYNDLESNFDANKTTNNMVLESATDITQETITDNFIEIQLNRPVSEDDYIWGFIQNTGCADFVNAINDNAIQPLLDALEKQGLPPYFGPVPTSLHGHATDSRSIIADYYSWLHNETNKPDLIICDFFTEDFVDLAIATSIEQDYSELLGNFNDRFMVKSTPDQYQDCAEMIFDELSTNPVGAYKKLMTKGLKLKTVSIPVPVNGIADNLDLEVYEKYRISLQSFKTVSVGDEGNETLEIIGKVSVEPNNMYKQSYANEYLFGGSVNCTEGIPVYVQGNKDSFYHFYSNTVDDEKYLELVLPFCKDLFVKSDKITPTTSFNIKIEMTESDGQNGTPDPFEDKTISINLMDVKNADLAPDEPYIYPVILDEKDYPSNPQKIEVVFTVERFNEYKVEIDHCHSDLDYEGTSGQITVEFWSGNKMVESRIKNGIADNCPTDDNIFIVNTLESITHVVVKTNSGDAFYIDQLRLYKNGSLNANHGADNGQGWCLSTDANDAHGAWKGKLAQSVCSPSKRFNFR